MNRLCLGLSALLLTAACGQPTPVDTNVVASPSSSPSPEPSPSPTVPVQLEGPVNDLGAVDLTSSGSTVSLDVSTSELGFDPTYIKVSAASNVTVTLTGEEGTDHTFTIESLGVDAELSSQPTETTFQLPTQGPVLFFCRHHVDEGMKGAFYFTDDDQAAPSPFPEADSRSGGSGSSGGASASGGMSPRRSTTSSSGVAPAPQPQSQPASGNPAVDPLDEEINRAVSGLNEPVEDNPSTEAESEDGLTSDEPGTDSISEPGAPGAAGAGG